MQSACVTSSFCCNSCGKINRAYTMTLGPDGGGGKVILSPVLVHFLSYSLAYSRTIFLPSSGSFSNGNPYLHRENSVPGVKYSLLQAGANVFLIRLDVVVAAVWFDCEGELLSMFSIFTYCCLLANKLRGNYGIQVWCV